MKSGRSNLVVIMADQLRYDFIIGEHTPNIAALAADSMVFPNAYCASPLCVPARGSFFTGRYPNETGSLINPWVEADKRHGVVREDVPNLYGMLAGEWDCWHTGKQHLHYDPPLERREASGIHWQMFEDDHAALLRQKGHRAPGGARFRTLVPELVSGRTTGLGNYSTPATGCYEHGFESFFDGPILQSSLDAIDRRDPSKPFFLSAMFLAPHPPFDIPEPWFSMVKEIELARNVGQWSEGQSPLQLYNLTGFIGSRYTREDWQEVWRVYAGLVRLFDDCVGQVVNRLKQSGLYDDTLIVVTSDHGEMLGSHRLWQKMCMYEESIRTPTLLKLPERLAKKGSFDQAVSHLDVLPTICDVLGVPAPEGMPGLSLIGPTPDTPRPIFVQFDGNGALGNFSRAVIRDGKKLIADLFKDEVYFELYDLATDPQEECNLVWSARPLAASLFSTLLTHMRATADHLDLTGQELTQFYETRPKP